MSFLTRKRKMRIGIFGGSFDPPHKGHITIACQALKSFCLDKIYFVPAYIPPHIKPKHLSDPSLRLFMLQKAIAPYSKKFVIDTYELDIRRKIYTYQTIQRYKMKFPAAQIYFVLGEDSLKDIPRWKKGISLLKMCGFIVAPRYCEKKPRYLLKKTLAHKSVFYLDMSPIKISSSGIRSFLWKGTSGDKVEKMLPPSVIRIIRKNYLYLDDQIRNFLEKNLDSAKFRHTLGVAELSRNIAVKVGADPRKAFISGLIHDMGRCKSSKEYLKIAIKNNLVGGREIEFYKNNPFLLHSHISAYLAKKIFGIDDKDILNAARNHTIMTTREKATLYDKIIYVADAAAGDRRYPGVKKIRMAALRGDIDRAVFLASSLKLNYVIKKKKYLMPYGVEVYNSFLPS